MRKEKKSVILKSAVAASIVLSIGLGVGLTWDNSVPKVMVITDAGSVSDKSFNNQAWDAAQAIDKATGGEASSGWIKPMSTSDDILLDAYHSTYDNGTQMNILTGFKHEPAFQKYKGTYSAPYTPATNNLVPQDDETTLIVDSTGKQDDKAIFIDDGGLGFGTYYNLSNQALTNIASNGVKVTLQPYATSKETIIPNNLENQEFLFEHKDKVKSNHPNTYSEKFETQEASFETAIMAWIYLDSLAAQGTILDTKKIAGAFTGMHIPTTYDFLSGFDYGLEYMNNIFELGYSNKTVPMAIGTTREAETIDGTSLSNNFVRLASPSTEYKNAGMNNESNSVASQWGSGTFDPNGGMNQSNTLNEKGAYVVMPIAGPQMFDTLYVFSGDKDKKIIGVDVDARNVVSPSQQEQVLTSVQKEIKTASYNFLEIWAYEEGMLDDVVSSTLKYPTTFTNQAGEVIASEGETIKNLEDAKIFGSIQNKANNGVSAAYPDPQFKDSGLTEAFELFKSDEDNFNKMNDFLAVSSTVKGINSVSSISQEDWDNLDIEGFASYISTHLSVIPGITDNLQYGAVGIPAASPTFVGK